MAKKKIVRVPIILSGIKYQTIASHNSNYEPCKVMGTYSSIEEARSHYVADMDSIKKAGEQYQHYAIREVEPEEEPMEASL